MRRIALGLILTSLIVVAPAAARPRHHRHPRAHITQRHYDCDGVARDHYLYHGNCNWGIGSPTAEGLDYFIIGWHWLPYLYAGLRNQHIPREFAGPMVGYLFGAAHDDNKQAPYDWAKDAPRSDLKAAAVKCLFWGTLAAGASAIWSFIFNHNTQIADAAKAGAIACTTTVAGAYFKGKLKQWYDLEI